VIDGAAGGTVDGNGADHSLKLQLLAREKNPGLRRIPLRHPRLMEIRR
jgi:hypothetical protein